MVKASESTSRLKLVLGVIVFALGFALPLLIPVVLNSQLSVSTKAIVSGILGIGGPEVLMIFAGVILGKENLDLLKNKIKAFFSPLAPPNYVSKARFALGISLFALCILETLVHVHWDGIVDLYAGYQIEYIVFWNILFLLSLYILGGDFFNRLIGLFKYAGNQSLHTVNPRP